MRHLMYVLSLGLSCLSTWTATAQENAPMGPPPQMKKFEPWVGEFELQVETKEPNGTVTPGTGKLTVRMILDGAFLEERYELQHRGTISIDKGMFVTGYDRSSNVYQESGYFNNGITTKSEGALDGDVRIVSATATNADGKLEKGRARRTLARDGKSMSFTWETYDDATKSWVPWFEGKATRISK